MANYDHRQRQTLVVLAWDRQKETGYATDQLKRLSVHIDRVSFAVAAGIHQGCQITCIVDKDNEAKDIRFARPEERLNPVFREVGTVKWVHPRNLYLDLELTIDRVYSLELQRDTITGHRSYGFSRTLQEMLEDGANLFGHEIAFDVATYDGQTAAANLTPIIDGVVLGELARQFALRASKDLPVAADLISEVSRGRREVEFRYLNREGPIHRVWVYMNSNIWDLIHELNEELKGYYSDYSIDE